MKKLNPNWLLMMSNSKDKRGEYGATTDTSETMTADRAIMTDTIDARTGTLIMTAAVNPTMTSTTATASVTTTASTT